MGIIWWPALFRFCRGELLLTSAKFIFAAGLAVGLAIGVMHILRCIHPPGGATALVAVVGSSQIHALGFEYILTPVLLNTVIILSLLLFLIVFSRGVVTPRA